ncbi:radical SAM protein, partial [bacterium]|nr:radical SAM protein [bacterium]
SRGCPYKCSYCSNFSRKTRFRSVNNILAEIAQVQKNFGTKQFMFKDDSFTLRRKRVENFCNKIISKKIKILWESTTRLDLVDDRLVKLMKRAGCNRIGVGVESGDEEMLKIYNKRLTKNQIRNGTNILTKNNIFWTGYFMMGLPMEKKEQMYKTLEFMKELAPPYAAIGIYKPYPGTKLFEMSEDLGLVNSDVTNEHFFCTNPVDYFFKDPHHRCTHIPEEELDKITSRIEKEFELSNKKLSNVLRRGLSRQKLYLSDPKSLLIDLKRAIKWLMP